MVNIPRNIKKTGTPLGGVGAERTTTRTHSLVLDDRLISKQFIANKAASKVSNDSFGGSWSTVEDVAPSKAAVHAYLNSLEVSTSAWTQEDASATNSKTRTFDSGNVGIGSTLAYSDITDKLTVDGDINVRNPTDGKGQGSIFVKNVGYGSHGSDDSYMRFYPTASGQTRGVKLLGNLTVGGTRNSEVPLAVNKAGTVALTDKTGIAIFGEDDSSGGLAFDENTIQARTGTGGSTAAAKLNINTFGGDIDLSKTGSTVAVQGDMTVGGNTTITGNLTVNGTATAIHTTNTTINDNIIVLNNDVTGTPSENAGIEVERGSSTNVAIRWNESTDKWQITNDGSSYNDISTSASDHSAVTIDNQGTGLLSLSTQAITVNDVMVKNSGDTMTGQLVLSGTSGSSGTTALSVTGGNSAASNAAVSITGHLEATTKSFNIPHPLLENKRLVYGSLEGPEHGMYARGSFDVIDDRRVVSVDLPLYWSVMVQPDYTVGLSSYGNYNVWIKDRNEEGFWIETDAESEWSFDWNVVGCRKDAKLEVEPNA